MNLLSGLRFLQSTFVNWVERHQNAMIENLVEENRLLKEELKRRGLRLTDEQRRQLAAKRTRPLESGAAEIDGKVDE